MIGFRTIVLVALLLAATPLHADNASVTYRVGWWLNQDGLVVTGFHVDVTDQSLGLLQTEASVRVHIAGTVTDTKGQWKPAVRQVHASERFVPSASAQDRAVLIELTPIVDEDEDSSYKGGSIPFDITFDYKLHTFRWGKNQFTFVLLGKEQRIELQQSK
jgi:hypothetical protein